MRTRRAKQRFGSVFSMAGGRSFNLPSSMEYVDIEDWALAWESIPGVAKVQTLLQPHGTPLEAFENLPYPWELQVYRFT